jgi:hypothetical protein
MVEYIGEAGARPAWTRARARPVRFFFLIKKNIKK